MTDQLSDEGATSVEYALIAFAIAAVIALSVFAFGDSVWQLFTDSCQSIRAEVPGPACT
jgi:pilus assembly protein Flp/PilA